jgi:cytochrome c peroxidase
MDSQRPRGRRPTGTWRGWIVTRLIRPKPIALIVVLAAVAAASAGRATRPDAALIKQARDLFGALPDVMASPANPVTLEKVVLGKMLFYEKRISADGTVSCWHCHPLSLYAADGLPKSVGVRCKTADRNAPTVFNAADQIAEHWTGSRASVEDQAARSLSGGLGQPSQEAALARIKAIPGYEPLFRAAFPGEPDPVTAESFGRAVGAFERTLVTPAPFDAFLDGSPPGLDEAQQAGLKELIATGCPGCHNGPYFGGRSFRKFGVFEPYWKRTLSPVVDEGRFTVTHDPADKYVFKVPVLRNVQMTSPYFHDGSVGRLTDAVWVMGKVQLGLDLPKPRIQGIVAFLEALTWRLATRSLEVPFLPAAEAGDPGSIRAPASPAPHGSLSKLESR